MSRLEFGGAVEGLYLDGRAITRASKATKLSSPQVLQGWACHYNVPHQNYKNNLTESFARGCFTGSLHSVMFLRDHILSEKKIADQEDGSLELVDTDSGIAFRVHLKDGDLEKLDGRKELSVGYHIVGSHLRKDGVLVIDSAILIEVSICHSGAIRQTFSEIRDSVSVGKLVDDARRFATDGAAIGFLRALRGLG
jgi:phage head maturation protease